MGGYFNQDAEFKTIISDLTAKINENIKPIDIWFVGEKEPVKYKGSVEAFSSDIATTRIANQKSSELHKIFNDIAAKTDSNDVSIFVSDCILSFPDDAVKKDPQINITAAPSTLKNNIFTTFSELKKRGQGVSIYAFKSKFYGTYYDYQNVKTKLKGNYRPFYVWVIANKDILKTFDTELSNISTFKPEKSLTFGLIEHPVNNYKILTQVENHGEWEVDDDNDAAISKIEIPKNDSIKFCVALNLDNLPAYAQDDKYLQKNLHVVTSGCQTSFVVMPKPAINVNKLTGPSQPKIYENATNFLIFSVPAMNMRNAQIAVTLPLHYDTWYQDWSCLNDKNVLATQNKTFDFVYLINGVTEAYDSRNKNYIDFSIQLSK